MIVTGGCYTELCKMPDWETVLGSGGRAAIALAQLGSSVEFCTYYSRNQLHRLSVIEMAGVAIHSEDRTADIAFSYLHPLSTPYIYPRRIDTHPPLVISAERVLRFGFLEGDAVVTAHLAVYDPQSPNAKSFKYNGSTAVSLAIVLNEQELQQLGGDMELGRAAANLMAQDDADIVIAKCGIRGAWVFLPKQDPTWIPAYHSSAVFKIGTGDIFSAAFAYYWMERGGDPQGAADYASRLVSIYAEAPTYALNAGAIAARQPAQSTSATVGIIAGQTSLPDSWLYEETVSRLADLGVSSLPAFSPSGPYPARPSSFLMLADTIGEISAVLAAQLPARLVVFQQRSCHELTTVAPQAKITNDYATALYWACWGNT